MVTSASVDNRQCLNCGETKESLASEQIVVCGIMEGYEQPELAHEWDDHQWEDWTDHELDNHGVKSEFYEKHRRTPTLSFMWIDCHEKTSGHMPFGRKDYGESEACMICEPERAFTTRYNSSLPQE